VSIPDDPLSKDPIVPIVVSEPKVRVVTDSYETSYRKSSWWRVKKACHVMWKVVQKRGTQ